ncbi:hypothetical protein [Vreelandella titanicae]|uniref:hypothetical protein n=1 Tax=Vreelandella titanicae TaxID=664683 RepID=UPI004044F814
MATLNAHTFARRTDAEAYYLMQIDTAAGHARNIDALQQAVYLRKAEEARRGKGPLIESEAKALGVDVADVAAQVLAKHDKWQQRVDAIEVQRIKAKADIRAAATAADMHRIFNQFQGAL